MPNGAPPPMMPPPPEGQPYVVHPYQGQPPQGQPYQGQPPQGQPYPGMPPQGMPPYGALPPPPPPGFGGTPKKGMPAWAIVLIVVGALVVLFGIGGYALNLFSFSRDVPQAKAGDCASVTGTKSRPVYKPVACDSAEANYTVAKSLDRATSCGGQYDEYTQLGGSGANTKLCLIPNWVEGNCYKLDDDTVMGYPKIDCKPGEIKIAKIIKGKTDKAACPEGSGGFTFPEPPTTICAQQL
jgi:hypothetical protein